MLPYSLSNLLPIIWIIIRWFALLVSLSPTPPHHHLGFGKIYAIRHLSPYYIRCIIIQLFLTNKNKTDILFSLPGFYLGLQTSYLSVTSHIKYVSKTSNPSFIYILSLRTLIITLNVTYKNSDFTLILQHITHPPLTSYTYQHSQPSS